jgi:hypothetical protein
MRFAVLLLLLFTCPARAQAPIDPGYFDLPAIHEPNIAIAPTLEPAAAATKAGGKLLSLVARVESSLIESNYQAHTEVVVEDGIYRWDCSGMMTWLLRKTAPVALSYVGSTRPVARDFVKAIASAPTNRVRGGWQRISNIPDLRPGDVFAFRRAAISTSKVTGHAGIVISAPVAVPQWPGVWIVRIADSTRAPHFADTRVSPEGGFGSGTIAFATDANGNAVGYGWHGPASAWIIKTEVVFGRLHR